MIADEDLWRVGAALDDRFGAQVAAAFGRALPGLVTDLTGRWGLRTEGLYDSGATSVVIAVTDRGGRPCVLKVSPDVPFLAQQTAMLRRLAPTGRVPEVVAVAEDEGAVLLERVLPGDTLDSRRGRVPPPRMWAALVADLHRASTGGVPQRLTYRCAEMIERIGARQSRPHVRAHVPDTMWEGAVGECLALLAVPPREVLLHGDLHLGNVLDGGARGLVVIDPKLCVGDPCFDVVDYVIADGGPAQMHARAVALARLVGIDLGHLLRWSRVNAVVTAVSRTAWSGPDERTRTLLAFATARH